ncbi:aminopeptidase [Aureococcus anophagefferens]|nr:aminopeptidase [Aureococcus anophagefferens]
MHQQHRPHKIAILHGPPQALPQEEDQKHPARRQPAAMVRTATREYDADVVSYLNAAVSAFHCVAEVRRRLLAAAFEELDERRPWAGAVKPGGSYFVTRNGSSLLAFAVGGAFDEATWFDRDLTLVGARSRQGRPARALVDLGKPICRIPTLAIHLSVGDERSTFKPNLQSHLPPMLASGIRGFAAAAATTRGPAFHRRARAPRRRRRRPGGGLPRLRAGRRPRARAPARDTQPAQLAGIHEEFVSSGRLDNQASCYCGTQALIEAAGSLAADASLRMLTMFDHEEVGSLSAQGANLCANSPAFKDVLSRAYAALEGRDEHAFVARSLQISSDMAHGVHPNYAEQRHDPKHGPKLQGGLVIKHNANQRYATNAVGAVMVREFAARADVPTQDFAVKADSGCGTTIGPITAALTGMRTVDVGPPQLSMHSCREMMGSDDVFYTIKLCKAAYEQRTSRRP